MGGSRKRKAEFVNYLTNESLEKILPFRTTQVRLANLMQHLANHSTYHRGQVALMMRHLDAQPLASHVFLVEGCREAASAQQPAREMAGIRGLASRI